jgi:peptidoglycan/xylan/chitin deacetylase (PgdA/CDA1 family)
MRLRGRNLLRRLREGLLRRLAPGPRILLYHRIAELSSDPQLLAVPPARFAEQLIVLRKRFQVLPLGDLVQAVRAGRASRRMAAITFDDGYADNLHEAQPLLARAGLPATVYVASGTLGTAREFWWDEMERLLLLPGRLPAVVRLAVDGEQIAGALGDVATYSEGQWQELRGWNVLRSDDPTPRHALYRRLCRRLKSLRPCDRETVLSDLRTQIGAGETGRETHRALSDEELRTLAARDVEIGGHTVSHPTLAVLTAAEQGAEIRDGNARLERIVGKRITGFSYPFGDRADFTAETINLLRQAGIEHACANYAERFHAGSDVYRLPRHVVRNWSPAHFSQWLAAW